MREVVGSLQGVKVAAPGGEEENVVGEDSGFSAVEFHDVDPGDCHHGYQLPQWQAGAAHQIHHLTRHLLPACPLQLRRPSTGFIPSPLVIADAAV